MIRLFDVNVLIAIVDPAHTFHAAIHRWIERWIERNEGTQWASCPITENGFVRVLSQPAYRGSRRTPAEAIALLRTMKDSGSLGHVFWTDDYSISEDDALVTARLVTSGQVTDVYLAALAARKGGTLLTFDRTIAWQCIPGATAALLENPAD